MSTATKDWISKWFPLLFALLSNVAVVAYGYGKMDQRLAPLERHVLTDTTERQMELFVSKAEFVMRNSTRDKELDELKQAIRDNNNKLDRIIERLSK